MTPDENSWKRPLVMFLAVIFLCALGWFALELRPVGQTDSATQTFSVSAGAGFSEIAGRLRDANLIRSKTAFEILAIVEGRENGLRAGDYRLDPSMSSLTIVITLTNGGDSIAVTIPEGWNVFQIDQALSDAMITRPGEFAQAARTQNLEGTLFPDTYHFVSGEATGTIVQTFIDNFNAKASPILASSPNPTSTLILASILEKEVQTDTDRRMVAGILLKRIAAHIPLGVDASVCYANQLASPNVEINCASLTASDFKIDSPYNSYTHQGLPPGPIGNPGLAAIEDAENPVSSSYFYYLTDPATGKTIYAATLAGQNANIKKYLE